MDLARLSPGIYQQRRATEVILLGNPNFPEKMNLFMEIILARRSLQISRFYLLINLVEGTGLAQIPLETLFLFLSSVG